MNAPMRDFCIEEGQGMRAPPHSIEAEQAVLGGLMIKPAALHDVRELLKESDFYRRDHQFMWRAITALIDAEKPIDALLMGDWLDENGLGGIVDPSYPLELDLATPSAANIKAYAEIVRNAAQQRELADIGARLAKEAMEKGADVSVLITKATSALNDVHGSRLIGALQPFKLAINESLKESMERYTSGVTMLGLETPWGCVNKATRGLRPGNVIVIAGRPSMGKSIIGQQIATHAAVNCGKRVAIFSVEMTRKECADRAIAQIAEIPHKWVECPDNSHPDAEFFWHRYTLAAEKLRAARIVIDDTSGIGVDQWVARATREHMRDPLDLIVLDHMHDMKINPDKARFEYEAIVQAGKNMAKAFNCVVVILAQLSRKVEERSDKRPIMADVREAGGIEQKADLIFFIYRDDYYNKESSPRKGTVELIVGKGRNLAIDGELLLQNIYSESRAVDWIGALPPKYPESTQRGGARRSGGIG